MKKHLVHFVVSIVFLPLFPLLNLYKHIISNTYLHILAHNALRSKLQTIVDIGPGLVCIKLTKVNY